MWYALSAFTPLHGWSKDVQKTYMSMWFWNPKFMHVSVKLNNIEILEFCSVRFGVSNSHCNHDFQQTKPYLCISDSVKQVFKVIHVGQFSGTQQGYKFITYCENPFSFFDENLLIFVHENMYLTHFHKNFCKNGFSPNL